jgi:hypothetical protein
MTLYKEAILDTNTGDVTFIEFTNKELSDLESRRDQAEEEANSKAEARLAAEEKLLALGLTAEDLQALLG